MLQIRDAGGTLRTITSLQMRDASNTLRTLKELWVRDASNTPRKVFSAFGGGSGANASPMSVRGTGRSNNAIAISTAGTTCTPAGGTAPYTYSWAKTSGADDWTIVFPTSPTTSFVADSVPSGELQSATFTCTVTDANGQTATSNAVSATAVNLGGFE